LDSTGGNEIFCRCFGAWQRERLRPSFKSAVAMTLRDRIAHIEDELTPDIIA